MGPPPKGVDIDGAKKLLNGATPTVRIMYNKDDPNRVDAFSLISERHQGRLQDG